MRPTVFVCLALLTAACGKPYLTWHAQPPAPSLSGQVAIAVTDHRASNEGGSDPALVGSERGALLIAHALRVSPPAPATIAKLFTQAAATAGVGVVATAPTKLAIELTDLWCDGVALAYTNAHLGATVTVVAPDGSVRAGPLTLHAQKGAGGCHDAFAQMLDDAYAQATNMITQLKPALLAP